VPAATTSAGTLSKALPAAGAGEATFGDLSITSPTGPYRLKASTTGLADVLSDPFTVDNGLATANGRPRRDAVLDRYRTQLDDLYQGSVHDVVP